MQPLRSQRGRADFDLKGLDGNKVSEAVLLAGIEGAVCE